MRFLRWFLTLFAIWIGLTNSFDIQELILGVIISALIVTLVLPKIENEEIQGFNILKFFSYLPLLFKNIVLSNIDVAKRVLDPKLPINPGIVRIKTTLKEPYKRLLFANSITLTPGTVTLDMKDDYIYIHWIAVDKTDEKEIKESIALDMELAIEKI